MSTFIGRVISATASAAKRALVRATILGRTDEVPHVQPYGLQARAQNGAEAIVIAVGATADDLVAVVVGDRRYTIALEAGEVALADDIGQKVHLTRSGIVVEAPHVTVNSADVRLGEGPVYQRVVCEGDTVTVGIASGPVVVTSPPTSQVSATGVALP